MDKEKLLQFLLEARTKTYAGGGKKAQPALKAHFGDGPGKYCYNKLK